MINLENNILIIRDIKIIPTENNKILSYDFKEVNYVSSYDLGIVFKQKKKLIALGYDLHLINVNKLITDIFKLTYLDKYININANKSN